MSTLFHFSTNVSCFREWVQILSHNWALTFALTKKETTDSFSGQVLGSAWAIGHPLFLMCFYVVVFSVLFPVKFGLTYEPTLDYTSYLLAGLVPWLSIQQAMVKSCSIITGNTHTVKQLTFPPEIFPLLPCFSSLLPFGIGIMFILFYNLFFHQVFYITYIFLPFAIASQLLLTFGISYALSSISVFLKDAKDILQLYTTVSMFLTPIVFMPFSTPSFLRYIFFLNPFSYIIWVYQDILYEGKITKPYAWVTVILLCPFVFIIGYRTFRKLKLYFGNAL